MAKIWESFTNQKQWEEYLKDLLKSNNKALVKALILIYQNQTIDEQECKESIEENGIGFNKIDAESLTAYAQKVLKGEKLHQRQLVYLKRTLPKYWRQLMVISKKNMQKQKLKDKEQEEIEKEIQEQITLEEITKKKNNEIYYLCTQCGQACFYGICHECPYENN